MDILKTQKLSKEFSGINAVDNLSISFKKGLITGIVGPNGSGKTTLVNVLTGILPATSGSVVVHNVTLNTVIAKETSTYGITRTFQRVRLFEQMSVLDNILIVLTEKTIARALFEKHSDFHIKEAEEILKTVGLWNKRNEEAYNLSYGQRKLLEISRAIAMKTEIILFDEPFAGLFPEMVKLVMTIITDLKATGKTIILIEHDMAIIRELCDHLIVMDAGSLLVEGRPDEVLSKKEVIESYLGQ